MDKTVILLIGAGVCCVVIGIALFVKLLASKGSSDEDNDSKKLLDSEYVENFRECFESTGNVEETLEELAHIYTGNQYMYNLIVNAIQYITEEGGDYETALDSINVDSDMEVMRIHSNAIKKSLGVRHFDEDISENDMTPEFDEDEHKEVTESRNSENVEEIKFPKNNRRQQDAVMEDEFDEDEEEPVRPQRNRRQRRQAPEPESVHNDELESEFGEDEPAKPQRSRRQRCQEPEAVQDDEFESEFNEDEFEDVKPKNTRAASRRAESHVAPEYEPEEEFTRPQRSRRAESRRRVTDDIDEFDNFDDEFENEEAPVRPRRTRQERKTKQRLRPSSDDFAEYGDDDDDDDDLKI